VRLELIAHPRILDLLLQLATRFSGLRAGVLVLAPQHAAAAAARVPLRPLLLLPVAAVVEATSDGVGKGVAELHGSA